MINLCLPTPRTSVTQARARLGVLVVMISIPVASTGQAFGPTQPPPPAPAAAPPTGPTPAPTSAPAPPPTLAPAPPRSATVAPAKAMAPGSTRSAPPAPPPTAAPLPPRAAAPAAAQLMAPSPPRTAPPAPPSAAPLTSAPAAPPTAAPPTAAPPTAAPPTPPPTPPKNPAVEAKRHFEQGVALYVDKNYQAALAEFQAARQLSPSPTLLYNIGLTQKALFNYLDAIQTLEAFLTQGARDPKVTPARRREVQQLVSEMKALLGDARITVTPVAATVTVDGQPVQVSPGVPTLVKLAAGPHTLVAGAPGFVDQTLPLTVTAGGTQEIAFTLVAVPTTARITISANVTNTAIRINGQPWGFAPMIVELPGGSHQIQANAEGHLAYQGDLVVVAGQDRAFQVALQPLALVALPDESSKDPLYKKWWFWAGIAATVGAAVIIAVATAETEGPLKGTLSPGVQPTP